MEAVATLRQQGKIRAIGALLTGKVTMERAFSAGDFRGHDAWFKADNRARMLAALQAIQPIADAHKATLAQLVIAWTIRQPGTTSAIAGARTPEQARENARAAHTVLSDEEDRAIRTTFEALGAPAK